MKNLKTTQKLFGALLMSILLFQCNTANKEIEVESNQELSSPKGKTLLVVLAHPDDELTVASILAKYVAEGAKVHLVIATDGRYGTNDGEYEAGDELAAMRKEEMQCSADILGVELTHLNYQDQLRSAEGYDGHIPHVRALIKEVHGLFGKIQPDAIITFGPEGWSNHMDHRLIGATVTQVFVSQIWDKSPSLYYVGMPSDLLDDPETKIIRGQDKSYLTTRVTYTDDQKDQALRALSCHITQMGEGALERMRKRNDNREKVVFLRKFVAPTETEDSVF